MAALSPPATPLDVGSDEVFTGLIVPDPEDVARLLRVIGRDLGERYELIGYLGRGAYATVWQARDRVTRQTVAVKRFDSGVGDGRGFFRELNAMFRLTHERFVRVINLMEASSGIRYLILEYCAGGNLRAAMSEARREKATCPPARAAVLALHIAEGLAEAHRLGLVHRDLKPENILFTRRDDGLFGGGAPLKLADFGLVRALQRARDTNDGALRALSGSPAYMAPEQFEGAFSPATDLYALGVILYELLHGRLPFEGTAERLAYQHLREPPAIDRSLPRPWPALVAALLDKEFTRRLPTAELIEKLRKVGRTTPQAAGRVARVRISGPDAAAFALFAVGTGFVAVAPRGLCRCAADGAPLEPIALSGIRCAEQAPNSDLWLARGGKLHRWAGAGSPVERLVVLGNIEALATPVGNGPPRVALVRADEVNEFQLSDTRESELLWRLPIRAGGLRPALLRLADGRLLCSEGPLHPRLSIIDAFGNRAASIPLPGLCWQLGRWDAGAYALLLVNDGFHAYRIDAERIVALPLAAVEDLCTLAVPPEGNGPLSGLRGDGGIVRWNRDGTLLPSLKWSSSPFTFRAFAADGQRHASLVRTADGCRVAVRSLDE